MTLLNMLVTIGQGIVLALGIFLAIEVGYLLLLTVAALFARRTTPARAGDAKTRFLVLAPAHNEEVLIERTVDSLLQMDYPRDAFTVCVIADNCTDRTAQLARARGAMVEERTNPDLRGKGYALDWALQRWWDSGRPCDAVVIIDADTDVSPNFLRVMDARLAQGDVAVQGYYAVRDPGRSWTAALRYAALAVLHYLRPQGRMTLGGSVGLKGNGMVFTAEVMRGHRWTASLTEDVEFHMNLVLDGKRVTFAPDAVVWAEMPNTLGNSTTQNARWERGRIQMVQRYVPTLLKRALAQRSYVMADAAMEQLIPPTSVLAFLIIACLVGGIALGSAAGTALGVVLLIGLAVYILTGLLLARAPGKVYLAMIYAPFLMLWKVWLYIKVLINPNKSGWVRTARNEKK